MLKRIWQLFVETFRAWGDARASQMAAALTYYTMLSLAPTLMIAIALASYLFDDRLAETQVIEAVTQFTTPEIAKTVAGLINRASQPNSGVLAGSISIAILVIGASGAFTQLYDTFNHIWKVTEERNSFLFTVQKRLIGIGMVLLVGLLLIAALVLHSVIGYLNELIEGYPTLLNWLNLADRSLSFLLMPVVFSLMFWFFPATRINLRDVIPAGVLTASLVAGSRYIIQWYLKFSSTSEVWGAAGSLVVLLIWIYITAMVVYFGASFAYAWSEVFGSRRPELRQSERHEHESDDQSPLVPQRRKADAQV